ncbi:MAG: hypothetical protein PHR06_05620 [Candidatus Cloacimonetes bacterium]|nr:hypothetical protein [Candidatus Cloacimonadota bacterium]
MKLMVYEIRIDLTAFKPQKLIKTGHTIEKLVNSRVFTTDEEKLFQIVKKIVYEDKINLKELRKIVFNLKKVLDTIDSKNHKSNFLNIFSKNHITVQKMNKNMANSLKLISPKDRLSTLEFLYANLADCDKEKLYEMKIIARNLLFGIKEEDVDSSKSMLFKFIFSDQSYTEFFGEMFLYNLELGREIKVFEENARIHRESNMFIDIVVNTLNQRLPYLIEKNKNNIDFNLCIIIDSLNSNLKIKYYNSILEYFNRIINSPENFNDFYFKRIESIFGVPVHNNPSWRLFSNIACNVFNAWLNFRKLENIFNYEVSDQYRLDFWKRYLRYFKEIEYFEKIQQMIVFETNRHTFIEFGKIGALYCYDINHINIQYIKSVMNEFSTNNIISIVKNRDICLFRKNHVSLNWHSKFEIELMKYGYHR